MPLWHPGPFHILTYGTLFGSSVFNTFVNGLVSYQALPRAQFAQLQSALFPKYFALQTILSLGLAVTYPGSTSPSDSVAMLLGSRRDALYIAASAALGAVNWIVLGPWTTKCMRERKHQETRDGKKSYDPAPHSDAMNKLNRRFMLLHSWSSLANVVAVGLLIAYGVRLGRKIA